jgi:quinol monooxygenase YgiN
MVIWILKYDINPDKLEAFLKWVPTGAQRVCAAPGISEYRAYRSFAAPHQVMSVCEFADLESYTVWRNNSDVNKVDNEIRAFTTNITSELWGPSPLIPEPMYPPK